MRDEIESTIDIERSEPTYETWEATSLSEFEDSVDLSSMTINLSALSIKKF